jgi:hypothetical protein
VLRLRALIRNRPRQVFLLVAAYALMSLGAPLAGAGIPCAGHEHEASAAALPAASATQVASAAQASPGPEAAPLPHCHEAAPSAQAEQTPAPPAPAHNDGGCCQHSSPHHCGCTLAVGAALPTQPLALSPDSTPAFAAGWTTKARLAEPPSRLLRPPIR